MMQIVTCSQCHQSGGLPIVFQYSLYNKGCEKCGHGYPIWYWHFCSMHCFSVWHQQNPEIPCQSCHQTGWAFGYEQNGKCETCQGKKSL